MPATPATSLDYIRAAASHPLLGETSLLDTVATGGSTTTLIDTANLITFANDVTMQGRWVYFYSGSNVGQERYVSAVNGSTGTLTWTNALSNAVSSGDAYLLFRDGRWSDWLRALNETGRSLYYSTEGYLLGVTDLYRYTLPTPFSRQEWLREVYVGPTTPTGSTGLAWSRPEMSLVGWHRINPLSFQGDLYLVLGQTIDNTSQLRFQGTPPYIHPSMSAFTTTQSVLTPFGQTTGMTPPFEWVVLGIVWRMLVRKERNLTGEARGIWKENRQEASRLYAAACQQYGVGQVALEQGWLVPW